MTDAQQKAAAKQFVADWKGKGYEKGQSQPFWLSLLGDVFGKPCIVVDTHCKRITNLLGLTKNTDPTKIEMDLRKVIPPEYGALFCHQIVEHGRAICIARRPKCSECGMNTVCDYYKKGMKKVGKNKA